MDVFDAVRTVLAVRHYQDKPVPAEVVERVLEAGRLTGSSMNLQPWHFIVVEHPETLRQLGQVYAYGRYVAQAPAAIVILTERDQRFAVSDASRAFQSMVLAAWAEGVGSNWVGFFGLEAARGLLDVPQQWEILAIMPLGYPVDHLGKGEKKRKSLEQIASRERFGRPIR